MSSVRKILKRLRGMNFCTSSACFASSFIRQPNSPECTQIVQNATKHQFRVRWGVSGAFIAKIPTRLRGTNFCTSSAHFAPSFVRQPNVPDAPKQYETHQNVSLGSNGVDWVRSCKKFRRDFVARTFALVRPVLHRVS